MKRVETADAKIYQNRIKKLFSFFAFVYHRSWLEDFVCACQILRLAQKLPKNLWPVNRYFEHLFSQAINVRANIHYPRICHCCFNISGMLSSPSIRSKYLPQNACVHQISDILIFVYELLSVIIRSCWNVCSELHTKCYNVHQNSFANKTGLHAFSSSIPWNFPQKCLPEKAKRW